MKSTKRIVGTILGIVLIITVLFATAYKASKNEERLSRFRERDQRQNAAFELGREVRDRIRMSTKANITIDEFQKEFGQLSDLEDVTDTKYADKTHRFFHEASQRTFYLRFDDGILTGSQSNHGTDDIDTGVVLESDAYIKSELVRTVTLNIAMLLWFLMIILSTLKKNIRSRAAIVLFIASLLCGLCWFLDPNYSPTFRSVMSNDKLFFFVIMFAISIGFVIADSNFIKTEIPIRHDN